MASSPSLFLLDGTMKSILWTVKNCPMDYMAFNFFQKISLKDISLSPILMILVSVGQDLPRKHGPLPETSNIGTYDNHNYWDFITFRDDYTGVVALTYAVENWWENYSEQVLEILNTLTFDTSVKEGGAYIYSAESEADKIGLYFTLKKISPAGATLVFHQYDEEAPTGELNYGDAFALEVLKNNRWEEIPVVVDGNYGFHDVAYNIPNKDTVTQELDWTWLYGTLVPGNYRIKKEIMDYRKSGDFNNYTLYAQFILN